MPDYSPNVTIPSMEVMVYQLGLIEYRQAADLQRYLAAAVAEGGHPPTLLCLEHPHVYTFGRQSDPKDLLWDAATLSQRSIQVEESDRGGEITYHGPRQLVGYPILPLGETGTLEYLRKLENILIQTLAVFDVKGTRVPEQTGVWVPGTPPASLPAKIASIGVRVDANRITRHGFALNVAPEMAFWEGIVACGLENQRQTSLADLLPDPPGIEVVSRQLLQIFARELNARLIMGESAPQPPPIV